MTEYIERQEVLALLAAAGDQQTEIAKQEEKKAAGSLHGIRALEHAAEVLVVVADAVRALPAAPVKEEKRTCS